MTSHLGEDHPPQEPHPSYARSWEGQVPGFQFEAEGWNRWHDRDYYPSQQPFSLPGLPPLPLFSNVFPPSGQVFRPSSPPQEQHAAGLPRLHRLHARPHDPAAGTSSLRPGSANPSLTNPLAPPACAHQTQSANPYALDISQHSGQAFQRFLHTASAAAAEYSDNWLDPRNLNHLPQPSNFANAYLGAIPHRSTSESPSRGDHNSGAERDHLITEEEETEEEDYEDTDDSDDRQGDSDESDGGTETMPPQPSSSGRGGGGGSPDSNFFVDLTSDSEPSPASNQASRGSKRQAEAFSSSSSSHHYHHHQAGQAAKRAKRERDPEADDDPEELDLATSADASIVAQTIAAQQAATSPNAGSGSACGQPIGKRTCVICLENFTDATVTHCGHIFCHQCLTQALMVGEKHSERGIGSCPVCRKPVSRKRQNAIMPVAFLKRSAFARLGRVVDE